MAKFVDSVKIKIKAGHGGPGSVHFLREKYLPRGGPDGGDGGAGGDVLITVNPQLHNLDHIDPYRKYHAEAGQPGRGQKKFGKRGEDLIITVPPGAVVSEPDSGENLFDANEVVSHDESASILICKGGKGGLGNVHFTSSVNQAPRYAQPGLPGEEKTIVIDLKLIADIGFVGFPNAGKSTLLSKMTNARPKIADYPFTTLIPQLGVITLETDRGPVQQKLADIPGIIEGAHKGSGLGLSFLQHIERVHTILYLLDLTDSDPIYTLQMLRAELQNYSAVLLDKPSIIVFNKLDKIDETEREATKTLYGEEVYRVFGEQMGQIIFISALEEMGIEKLKTFLIENLDKEFDRAKIAQLS